ncbi:Putative peptidoglycan binding domain protein [Falsiruegeria litorea R37]|uniref:Putative peptidoglycan binding domain protein n=2 Tax=Falsiruegeria litorea TaxID=1280831 RepID=A0A1Y5SMC0_9RHOB|nr:Putative peptidoglycan binding domain protein [Falsiruegeria litorea R37]
MVMTETGNLIYTRSNLPHILYFSSCGIAENDTLNCSLDCDGGNMSVTHSPSELLINASIRIEQMQIDSVLYAPANEADGTQLNGSFTLTPMPLATCREIENRTPPIELAAGDVNVLVEGVEKNLISGGYLLGAPDYIFDGRTRDALIAYQQDAGLAPTGTAGPNVRRQLATDSLLAFGGC